VQPPAPIFPDLRSRRSGLDARKRAREMIEEIGQFGAPVTSARSKTRTKFRSKNGARGHDCRAEKLETGTCPDLRRRVSQGNHRKNSDASPFNLTVASKIVTHGKLNLCSNRHVHQSERLLLKRLALGIASFLAGVAQVAACSTNDNGGPGSSSADAAATSASSSAATATGSSSPSSSSAPSSSDGGAPQTRVRHRTAPRHQWTRPSIRAWMRLPLPM